MQESAQQTEDSHTAELVKQLVALIEGAERLPPGRKVLSTRKPEEREAFRIHPKGLGVFYMGQCVLPPRTFVQRYVGELYCAWRWAEKNEKSASMKRRLTRMGNMPELYSMTVERPKQDLLGFDVIYVDVRVWMKT